MYSSLFQQLLCQILDSTEKPNLDQKGLGLIVTVWFGLDIVGIVRHLADPYTTQSLDLTEYWIIGKGTAFQEAGRL